MGDDSWIIFSNTLIDADSTIESATDATLTFDSSTDCFVLKNNTMVDIEIGAPTDSEWIVTATGEEWVDTDLLVLSHPSPDQILTYEDGTFEWVAPINIKQNKISDLAVGKEGDIVIIKDGLTPHDCSIGGGRLINICIHNGNNWVAVSDGGSRYNKQHFESIEQRIINLENREDQTMFTTTNILIIMLICIITVKFVIPKLTIKYILRKFANLVYKPGKKKIEEVETEWEKAKTE